jgi:hypothetical protein
MKKKNKYEDDEPKKKNWLIWGGLTLLVGLLLFHVWNVRHLRVPDEIVGTWTTAAPQYQGKSFEIGPSIVSFELGDGAASTGFIQDIQTSSGDGGTLYTISYKSNGLAQQVAFIYGGDQTIHFKNRKDIAWTKASTD